MISRHLFNREAMIASILNLLIVLLAVPLLTGLRAWASGPLAPEDLDKLKLIEINPPVKAPGFVLKDLQGNEIRLEKYKGRPLMLYFWASW